MRIFIACLVAVALVVIPPTPAQAWERTLTKSGAYGIAKYWAADGDDYIQAYVHDTARDGLCAEMWMDFTRTGGDPQHHDAVRTIACAYEKRGWGKRFNASDSTIDGAKIAICTATRDGARRSCANGATWPELAYTSGYYKETEAGDG